MTTLFISDLHLAERRPETTDLLQKFLLQEASSAQALYILGDLFEFWLGDDVPSKSSEMVAQSLIRLKVQGVPCFFMHGNRDFLLHKSYADRAGMTLIPEEHIVDLYGEQVLLMHGDSLCTDDVPYQQFRSLVRNPAWQQDFLKKSPHERLEIALQARDASAEHKDNVKMQIMDVNQGQVEAAFERHGVSRMIHGHTHRPAKHDVQIDGHTAQRIVLGDWYTQGSVLRVDASGHYELSTIN